MLRCLQTTRAALVLRNFANNAQQIGSRTVLGLKSRENAITDVKKLLFAYENGQKCVKNMA